MADTSAARPTISDREFAQRRASVQRIIGERGWDALLVNSHEADFANVRYLSDYWPVFESAGVLLTPQGEATLLIGPEAETYARDRSRIDRIRKLAAYRESADPEYPDLELSSFTEVFEEAGAPEPRRIGIAGRFATNHVILEGLQLAFPKAELVGGDDVMVTLRRVKSNAEIACLRSAFAIAEAAIDDILDVVRPGMTELEVVGIAQAGIYGRGAEYEGMPQYVLSGPNSRHAVSRAGYRQIGLGELVQLNISARVEGYASGVGRPICLGRMSEAQRDLVEFGMRAHRAVEGWLHRGANASAVAAKYLELFANDGRESLYLYGPCHGLGLIEVEPPWMETTSHYTLEPNMTFQIDTFLLGAEAGIRWENGVRVWGEGVEALSSRHMGVLEIA